MSSGKIATPPQPIGSPQPTNVSPATDGGAAKTSHHTRKPAPSTPSKSRTTPSVTSAATPRLAMRAHKISPKMPASVTPMASTTAIQPSGMASIAGRVEIGDDHDSGVARPSRAGTKRSVKADPTSRGCPGRSGRDPRIQTFRRPFLRRTVVMVAVETRDSVAMASGVRDIEKTTPVGDGSGGRILRGASGASSAVADTGNGRLHGSSPSSHLITDMRISLLNLQADLHEANSTSPQNTLEHDTDRRV